MIKPQYNKYLQPLNSPIQTLTDVKIGGIPAWQFGVKQRIQTRRVKASALSLSNIASLSTNGVGRGGFTNGATLFLSSTLTPLAPIAQFLNFAVPFVAIYQGTNLVSPDPNFQIYPTIGGSITPFSYTVQGMLDWHLYNGTTSAWGGAIQNNTGGSQQITFIVQWKLFNVNSGTQTRT